MRCKAGSDASINSRKGWKEKDHTELNYSIALGVLQRLQTLYS